MAAPPIYGLSEPRTPRAVGHLVMSAARADDSAAQRFAGLLRVAPTKRVRYTQRHVAEQLWFAGLPVVDQRDLQPDESDRLVEFAGTVRNNVLGTLTLVLLLLAAVVAMSFVSLVVGWLGLILLSLTSGLIRFIPTRRVFSPLTLLALRKDVTERRVYVCVEDDATIEVLMHSQIVWTRFGVPANEVTVAHLTTTAPPPIHAGMAANFVRPLAEPSGYHAHQRPLSDEELTELARYAPLPSVPVMVTAIVASVWGLAAGIYFIRGILPTLLPSFLSLVLAIWASRASILAISARRRIASDLEAGYVVIVRSEDEGELGAAQELLPSSLIVWTEGGRVAEWRKHVSRL